MAVAVQVGGDAALAARSPAPGRTAVDEAPVVVAEERRSAAGRRAVRADVALAVGVDDEEVEPAVVVVVEPADAAAHVRRRVGGDARSGTRPGGSRARPAARRRSADAGEPARAAARTTRARAGARDGVRAVDARDEPAARVALELERLAERRSAVAADDLGGLPV